MSEVLIKTLWNNSLQFLSSLATKPPRSTEKAESPLNQPRRVPPSQGALGILILLHLLIPESLSLYYVWKLIITVLNEYKSTKISEIYGAIQP